MAVYRVYSREYEPMGGFPRGANRRFVGYFETRRGHRIEKIGKTGDDYERWLWRGFFYPVPGTLFHKGGHKLLSTSSKTRLPDAAALVKITVPMPSPGEMRFIRFFDRSSGPYFTFYEHTAANKWRGQWYILVPSPDDPELMWICWLDSNYFDYMPDWRDLIEPTRESIPIELIGVTPYDIEIEVIE